MTAFRVLAFLFFGVLIALILIVSPALFTDREGAMRTLTAAGYTDVRITGYAFFGCGDDDAFRTAFEARGVAGTKVTGVVCRGIWKGATIRTW